MTKPKPIKVYLAAGYSRKYTVATLAKQLESKGIDVVSTWHREKVSPASKLTDVSNSFLRSTAKKDINELTTATHFVMLSVEPTKPFVRGGSCVENGFAIAKGLPVLVIGPRQHIFHYLPGVKRVDTMVDGIKWLQRQQEA